MNNSENFTVEKGVLVKYNGTAAAVTIPDGIKKVGSRAFQESPALRSVTVPGSVKSISDWAFYKCPRLKTVNISEGTVNISETAFRYCAALETVTVPASVKVIRRDAFFDCKNVEFYFSGRALAEVPENFRTIETIKGFAHNYEKDGEPAETVAAYAGFLKKYMYESGFGIVADDGALIRLLIYQAVLSAEEADVLISGIKDGENVEERAMLIEYMNNLSFGTDEFKNFENMLEENYVPLEMALSEWRLDKADDGSFVLAAYIGDKPLVYCPSKIGDTVVSALGEAAFSGHMCKKANDITSVILPEGIREIPAGAFSGCGRLESVIIPDSVTEIRDGAFGYCYSLKSVNIPEGVTCIGERAFTECLSLERIFIPDSVKNIGINAFLNCDSLEEITVGSRGLNIAGNAFHGCGRLD